MHLPPAAAAIDAAQQAVVDLDADASAVVVGAPGTGKTSAIIARVAALAAAGVPLDDVLVLTPTRQAATALRDRLAVAVGVATAGPLARSVAAFAFQVVRAAVVHAGAEPPQLLTGPDEDRIVQDLLAGDTDDDAAGASRWPQWLPAEVRAAKGFRTEVRAFLAEATALGIDPAALSARAERDGIEVWQALASFAGEYHDVRGSLRGAHRDAAGLVREAVALLRALPPAAPQLGALASLRCVLVDDAQELTLGGVELLEALRRRGVAVVAVGDPDVSSGAFRGATAENFARLAAGLPLHVLGTAHRGTPAQRALLAEVTARIGAVGVVAHRSAPAEPEGDDGSVAAFALRSQAEEYDTIARLLRERHIHEGVPWGACAVIAHDARQVGALEAELAAREVPTGATGPTRTLSAVRAVRDILGLIDLAGREQWGPDDAADALLGAGFDPIELRRLRSALRHRALAEAEASAAGGVADAASVADATSATDPAVTATHHADAASGTDAVADAASGTNAVADAASGTDAVADAASGTDAVADAASGTNAAAEGASAPDTAAPAAPRHGGVSAPDAGGAEPRPAGTDRTAPVPSARELLTSAMAHPLEFTILETREGRRAARVAETIALLRRQLAEGATAHELLWTVWERSGRERAWEQAARGHGPLAAQAARDLDAVVALFQAAKRHGEREDGTAPLAFLRGVLDADVAEDRLSAPLPADAVRVMTPAGALGTEFDTVVIAGVQDGVWPNLRARGSLLETWRLGLDDAAQSAPLDRRRGVLHDELRLFARAVSRARHRLVVTAVDDDDTGPSALFELLPPAQPAPAAAEHPLSLRGLVAQHRRTLTAAGPGAAGATRARAVTDAAAQLALLAAAEVPGADPSQWYGVAGPTSTAPLRDLAVEDVRVSPSRLHALEECELNWVIADLGGESSTVTAGLGTILHAAMEHAEDADEQRLWQAVEERWGELEFDAAWIERSERERARDLVSRMAAYLRDGERGGVEVVSSEPHFEVRLPIAGGEQIGPSAETDGSAAETGDSSADATQTADTAETATPETATPDTDTPAAEPHGIVLSGYIDRVERHPDGRVVIVDLKTGRSEKTSAPVIAVHPQLAAYQLAFERGGVAGDIPDPVPGGAMLLVLKQSGDKPYLTALQAPFDDQSRGAFLSRLDAAATVMRGDRFLAPYEAHCRDDHTYGVCRIHTVGAVSSS
ncbi:PD-(D/E)XK nuclease family protein [Microbacterium sp. W1N]|uniref:PD-(D/E)XK nuclease family protein n=1 Tax=Microbacterium festucae TaxID=2977531 RepID=UPI0021C0757C|nr:PD-(D/E)XK nuclease family protein [Microbacterium festucae]MCT9820441.1 PD-(D/E)XK nuclease family protein [Microbacterium festucae]